MRFLNGWAKLADATGATKSSLASADALGAQMPVVEPGSANTYGDLRVRQQNDGPSTAAQKRVALPNDETAK